MKTAKTNKSLAALAAMSAMSEGLKFQFMPKAKKVYSDGFNKTREMERNLRKKKEGRT